MKDYKDLLTLYLFRGVPGAGKTDLAENLLLTLPESACYAADDYFTDENGNYNFDASKLKDAHELCQNNTENAMKGRVKHIFATNTFTRPWEMKKYYELAKNHGYRVVSLVVENRHGNKNIHGVPEETLDQMVKRFEVKL